MFSKTVVLLCCFTTNLSPVYTYYTKVELAVPVFFPFKTKQRCGNSAYKKTKRARAHTRTVWRLERGCKPSEPISVVSVLKSWSSDPDWSGCSQSEPGLMSVGSLLVNWRQERTLIGRCSEAALFIEGSGLRKASVCWRQPRVVEGHWTRSYNTHTQIINKQLLA